MKKSESENQNSITIDGVTYTFVGKGSKDGEFDVASQVPTTPDIKPLS